MLRAHAAQVCCPLHGPHHHYVGGGGHLARIGGACVGEKGFPTVRRVIDHARGMQRRPRQLDDVLGLGGRTEPAELRQPRVGAQPLNLDDVAASHDRAQAAAI
eukprot:scaffold22677_cov105-Isochrysis_galbana.AAC.3